MTKKNELPEDLKLYHFTARGCSGKAVRCRELTPDQVDAVVASAAKRLTPDATNIEFKRMEQRIGAETMLVDVSRTKIAPPETCKDEAGNTTVVDHTLDPDVRWDAFNPEVRQLSTKDWSTLMEIYKAEYTVSPDDVEAIMGKARAVSTG